MTLKLSLAERLPEGQVRATSLKHELRSNVSLGGGKRKHPELSHHALKVLTAIINVRASDPSTLVLAVWDRDGQEERLRDRDRIHHALRSRGEKGCAIAVCVEEVEAWLIADASAFVRCFGRGPKGGLSGAPETEPDPKRKLMATLNDLGVKENDRAALYRMLAENVGIDELTKRCPRGFGELRKALREFIEPCLVTAPPN